MSHAAYDAGCRRANTRLSKRAARVSHRVSAAQGMLSPLSNCAPGAHFSRAGREPKGKEPLPDRGKSPPIKMDPEKYDVMNGVGGRGYSENRPRSGSIYDDGRLRGFFFRTKGESRKGYIQLFAPQTDDSRAYDHEENGTTLLML